MRPLFSMFFLFLVVIVGCSAEVGENDKADIALIEFDPDSIEIEGDLGSFVPVNPSANYPMITSSTPEKPSWDSMPIWWFR